MNINFKDLFNPIILKRGYDYYKENKVSNIDVSSNQIFGIVNGKENYFVTIDLFHNKIDSAECTCPYDNPFFLLQTYCCSTILCGKHELQRREWIKFN